MSFSAIELDRLPAPEIIERIPFENLFQQRKARLIELAPHLAPALELESEPLVQLLQEDAYRELTLRAAVQDAGRGMLLAFASGAALDHMAAYYGVQRQVIQTADPAATPPLEEILEEDARLRRRVQLAPEGFTTAGTIGSYTFWALSASPLVKSVAPLETATPGEVRLVILSTEGDGRPDAELLAEVGRVTKERRPDTDHTMVEAAQIQSYAVNAELILFDGPDAEVVRAVSEDAVAKYVSEHHQLGHDITMAGLLGALVVHGVQDVVLHEPAETLIMAEDQAAYCTDITVTIGGRNV